MLSEHISLSYILVYEGEVHLIEHRPISTHVHEHTWQNNEFLLVNCTNSPGLDDLLTKSGGAKDVPH